MSQFFCLNTNIHEDFIQWVRIFACACYSHQSRLRAEPKQKTNLRTNKKSIMFQFDDNIYVTNNRQKSANHTNHTHTQTKKKGNKKKTT